MRKEYTWEIKADSTPLLKRSCSHCDSDRFYCSEKFRMNAQKKNTSPESINKELFHKFQENNRALAWEYAFSAAIRKKNQVEPDLAAVTYNIQYEELSMADLNLMNTDSLFFKVIYPFGFQLKLATVIRTCLKLSSKQLDRLIVLQAITVQGKFLEKKHRVKHATVVEISSETLKHILQ